MPVGTTKITRTFGTPTDRDKWTYSAWVKISHNGAAMEQGLFLGYIDANNYTELYITETGQLLLYNHLSGSAGGNIKTNRVFKDSSAFYHIQVVWDSGNAVEADRVKFYINGVQETSLATSTYPAIDTNSTINGNNLHEIGAKVGSFDFGGVMSHVQFVDGSALAPTEFGQVDATSEIWKIKTSCYGTPGNNGFCLKMEDSSNLDLDSSSNAATFSTTGTLTATKDNPSNNFATMNILDKDSITFSNGNTTLTWSATNKGTKSTLGMAGGKWYAECKATDVNGGSSGTLIGVGTGANFPSTYLSATNSGWGYRCQTGNIQNGAGNEAYGNTYTDGDIIGVAIDVDNGYVYMSKNGVWQDSGDPTSGASGTGAANNQPSYGAVLSGTQFFGCSSYDTDVLSWNFGNGYFATTSTGTTEADDAGIGQFKYDVPTGYYALCTKNIKLYG